MKQSDLDALIALREKRIRNFFLWLWLVVFPVLGLVMYLFYSAQPSPAHPEPAQTPTYNCQAEAKSLANIDAGGQIAPLCGGTPYPTNEP